MHGFVPVPPGRAYHVDSAPADGLVRPDLAVELRHVLERFAREAGFREGWPIGITFRPGVVGHHKVGRAADIYAVGELGLDEWKGRWDRAMRVAVGETAPEVRLARARKERRTNLGWRLYKALQRYGRWAQPYGYPIQLFGPWTRSEGPWRYISDRLLHAHRDHIHVAL